MDANTAGIVYVGIVVIGIFVVLLATEVYLRVLYQKTKREEQKKAGLPFGSPAEK